MSVTVRQSGMQTTVQDLGRLTTQHLGVPVGGAMDEQAHRIANLLVGNPPDAAALECALGNVALQFDAPALVALTGREITASLRSGARAMPMDRLLVSGFITMRRPPCCRAAPWWVRVRAS